ncbi:RNA 3'-terminal phosphate cyclase-domain-containing protein [Cadophora sp. MPI-SDFR-AT-0126]|nr:RNA 3'-terminal phosphate cyclase-domain-containing protein [Leotiomycetes sp. MPI-SDFR-AT-0126]
MARQKVVTLDGRTGEGGGQLSKLTPFLGLKAQHVSCIQCLADATDAEVTGCSVGSKTIEFKAKLSPEAIKSRNIRVKAESAASILLVFQATLPFFLFAGDEPGSPITLTIQGGSNVSFSLSFEYLDQVLLPALERFGIRVDRKLEHRGWSHGTPEVGSAKFVITPVPLGQSLQEPHWPTEQGDVTRIDVSLLVPAQMQESLKSALTFKLGVVFPHIEVNFLLVGDSRNKARMYTLLVAHTSTGLRFGRDWLYSGSTKNPDYEKIVTDIARKVVNELDVELKKGGVVDEYLQDQLVVFQALSGGRSSITGTLEALASDKERVDRTDEPFGDGSLHTTTARWVASQLLPQVKWIDGGRMCEGAGWKTS